MTPRSVALFTHVAWMLALFVALAIEHLSLALVRTAHPEVRSAFLTLLLGAATGGLNSQSPSAAEHAAEFRD